MRSASCCSTCPRDAVRERFSSSEQLGRAGKPAKTVDGKHWHGAPAESDGIGNPISCPMAMPSSQRS
jgi:hypothetical protein